MNRNINCLPDDFIKKLKRVLLVLLCLLLIPALAVGIVEIRARTVANYVGGAKNRIFVPGGIADQYEDPLCAGFDDFRTWTYFLNAEERRKISTQFNNGIWKNSLTAEFEDCIKGLYKSSDIKQIPIAGDNIFWCVYDETAGAFCDVDERYIHNNRKIIFIYDAEKYEYRCIIGETV